MRLALHWKIIIGLLLGILWAFLSGTLGWNKFTTDWIAPFGSVFINLLKLIAVPLILFSIIKGIAGLSDNIEGLGRLGLKTISAYLITTIFAVSIGLVLVNVIKPGNFLDKEIRVKNRLAYELWVQEQNGKVEIKDGKKFLDNPEYQKYITEAEKEYEEFKQNTKNNGDLGIDDKRKKLNSQKDKGPLAAIIDMVPNNLFGALVNNKMLQVIFFSIFFGIALISIDKKLAVPMINFIDSGNEIFLKMVDIIMKGAPYFVFALMAGKLVSMASTPQEMVELIGSLAYYSGVVVLGLLIMLFVVYPTFVLLFVKKFSYGEFFRKMSPAQLLAFSSSSSAATLPVTMECVNDNLKIPKKISDFVLPIGATVNMDGTSLYQAVAVIFLAQIHFIDLSFTQQMIIVLTATLSSIGSAAVPSAGLVMLILVLESVGLNGDWIAIIFPVDRILDMMRTVINVTGDATVSAVIAKSEKAL